MAIADKLTKLSTDITNAYEAIEDKGGTIPANKNTDNLENAIRSIKGSTPTKVYPPDWSQIGYEDTPQTIIDGFNYAKEIYDNWDSSVTSMANKYNADKELKYFPSVDTSNVTNMYQCFLASELTYIPAIDTSNVSSFMSAFRSCTNLISADLFDTSNAMIVQQMFDSCTNLKTVPVFDISKVTDPDRMFNNCPNLSNESLNNILEMCINSNVTNTSYKKLSRVGLSSAQATICQGLSNWNDFVAAGWTTGY